MKEIPVVKVGKFEFSTWLQKKEVPASELDAFSAWWNSQKVGSEEKLNPSYIRVVGSNFLYLKLVEYSALSVMFSVNCIFKAILALEEEALALYLSWQESQILLSCGLPQSAFSENNRKSLDMKEIEALKSDSNCLQEEIPASKLDVFRAWWKSQIASGGQEKRRITPIKILGEEPMFKYIKSNFMYLNIIEYNCLAAVFDKDFIFQGIISLLMVRVDMEISDPLVYFRPRPIFF
jgi:hypothetical protein